MSDVFFACREFTGNHWIAVYPKMNFFGSKNRYSVFFAPRTDVFCVVEVAMRNENTEYFLQLNLVFFEFCFYFTRRYACINKKTIFGIAHEVTISTAPTPKTQKSNPFHKSCAKVQKEREDYCLLFLFV